ncbi:MAG TPA: phosphatase PAP2 family protein [Longimicrobiaceae bacterium]|nr:phosphatase PAP2 family protein [Longimicrobiaceae bacterium]
MSTTRPPPVEHERRAVPRAGLAARVRDLLFGVLRWIAGHVRGFHAAIGVFLIAGVALLGVCVFLFVTLAYQVMEGRTSGFDRAILLWLNRHSSPGLDQWALEVTALGASLVVWMLVAVASVFLWVSKHRYSVLLLWVAILGTGIVSSTLKAFYGRPRPDVFPWRTPYAPMASFPSGHSMTAMVAYGTLAYLIARLEPTPGLRRLTFVFAGAVIVLIGVSRMYLGVHWPTDVIGGFAMGLAWAAFCALSIEALRYFRTRKPEVEEIEHDLDAEPERELGLRR